jgi:hypothetical protein
MELRSLAAIAVAWHGGGAGLIVASSVFKDFLTRNHGTAPCFEIKHPVVIF